MKKVFQVLLIVAALFLSLLVFRSIMRPEKLVMIYKERRDMNRDRLITLRTAQTVYRSEFKKFASDVDSLYHFVNHGTITVEKNIGEVPENMTEEQALAAGLLRKEIFKIPVSDKMTELDPNAKVHFKDFHLIPFNHGKKYTIQTASLSSSTYEIPVYRIDIPGSDVMANIDESINPPNTGLLKRIFNGMIYNGLGDIEWNSGDIYMGSLTESSTAGSWE